MSTGEVEVRDVELRLHVQRSRCGRGSGGLEVESLHTVEQADLAQAGDGVLVARVLRECLLIGGDGRTVVAALDGGERLRVQRRQLGLGSGFGFPVSASPTGSVPETPFCAATWSSCAKTSRTCCSGTAPVNIGTGWPAMRATTIGMDCARKLCASCGFASTSTFARSTRPPSSRVTFSMIGLSCLHGPHHSAHRSTTTGTVRDSSRT